MSAYIWQGNGRTFFCTSISDITAPTVAEVTGGTEVTELTRAYNGWSFKTNQVEVPNARSPFVGTIPGTQKAEDSSLVIYMDSVSNDFRAATPRGTEGFMVHVNYKPEGDPEAGDIADVFPVIVSGQPKRRALGDDAFDWTLECSITSEPAEDVEIAA